MMNDYVKLELTDMSLTRLGQKSFRPIVYVKTGIKTDDSKFETSIFLINDNSLNFDLNIGSDVI